MKALLITAAFLFAQDTRPAQQPGQPGAQPRQPGAQPGQPAATPTPIDGSWTIVDFERNGRDANEMKNKTVTIRGNVLTFEDAARPGLPGQPGAQPGRPVAQPGATAGKSDLKPMKLEFGPEGKIRVTEMAAGAQPGAQPGQPGAPRGQAAKTGVYAATHEFLVISILDDGARPGQPGAQPGARPGQPGSRPGLPVAAQEKPEMDNPMTIVLKKNGHGEQPGARPGLPGARPGQPRQPGSPPDRD